MSWFHSLVGIAYGNAGWPAAPSVANSKIPISEDIQFFSIAQANELMNYEFKNLDVGLIKKGCEIVKAPYIGGGTFWVKRTDDPVQEEEAVKEAVSKEIWKNVKAIVVFSKLDKNHPRYSYFQVIAIRSEDLLDLKKALKIHKLKAFL